ncbi:putative transcriptional regulator YdeE [Paenibacillus turicensis]|uniref:Transcriptional regulator YdeE n=1 Tax=Paenibacillus turicensis TaxID=160487 RepID=A0ABS4FPL3_9BACL|nr:effector binding domain-containing protein [Paenibacillus turicensis]MBP1904522.1 putative transcriptional regulator YdeE [Paenibacillus turicensis]
MTILNNFAQTRINELEAVTLVGFKGNSLDEEDALFDLLSARSDEITNRKNQHQYMVVEGSTPAPVVAVEVTETSLVPEGMISYTIPKGEYVVFSFEAAFIGDFWEQVCSPENQDKYNIDLSKPRFEIFTSELQENKKIEWYIPTK